MCYKQIQAASCDEKYIDYTADCVQLHAVDPTKVFIYKHINMMIKEKMKCSFLPGETFHK